MKKMAEAGDYDDDNVDERTSLINPNNDDDDDDTGESIEMSERNQRRIRFEEKEKFRKTSTHGGTRTKKNQETSFITGKIPEVEKMPPTFNEKEQNQDEDDSMIKSKFPNFKFPRGTKPKNMFKMRLDEYGNVKVQLMGKKSVEYYFFNENGELNSSLPKTFTKYLGESAVEIITENYENISELEKKNIEDRERMQQPDIIDSEKEQILNSINLRNERIERLAGENGRIQDRMAFKDRIKSIFKEHGFTITAIIASVGVIIGVIISNLSGGISKLGKSMANGLKEIGKKLSALLPGMIGAIANFIFKTAGELISFLGKNAWLLIIAVVIFIVDQFKKKKK